MNKTETMIDNLIARGHLIGYNPEDAAKLIPQKHKMVLLRYFYDWQDNLEFNSFYYENRFLDKWQPIRNYLQKKLE